MSGRKSERGASLVEYGLLLALLILIGIAAIKVMGATTTKPLCLATGALMSLDATHNVRWRINPDTDKPQCVDMINGPLW